MATQLVIQGKLIELGDIITYNFQVGDIGEIDKSKSNYTTSFKIPRTSTDIVRMFDGLAIPADNSRWPYMIQNVDVLDDYTPLMQGGILLFRNTDKLYYNVAVISGSFDFFTELGDTLFSDMDIPEIIHEKTTAVVADNIGLSIGGGEFRYILADYGGRSHWTSDSGEAVNIDYLIPAVSAKYLWDKVFETFPRFTFSGNFYVTPDFQGLRVTFPYPPYADVGEPFEVLHTFKGPWNGSFGFSDPITGYESWDSINYPGIHYLDIPGSWTATADIAGVYRIDVEEFIGNAFSGPNPIAFVLSVTVNGNEVIRVENTEWDGVGDIPTGEGIKGSAMVDLEAGDIINFALLRPGGPTIITIFLDLIDIRFHKVEMTADSLRKVYGLKAFDFVKEVMWRYGLITFVEGNHIEFVGLSEILDNAEVVDWSGKYSERTNEDYSIGYARNNYLTHQYDEEFANYFDKNIVVDNANLDPNKDIVQSNFFAPSFEKRLFTIYPGFRRELREYPTFDGDEDKYKTNERNFFIRGNLVASPYLIGSESMGDTAEAAPGPVQSFVLIEDYTNVSFASNPYYDSLVKILDRTRVHRINLLLTPVDINQLDMKKLYYFEQEAAIYMLNKLQYKKGEPAKGEFIMVRPQVGGIWVPIDPYCITLEGLTTGNEAWSNLRNALDGEVKPNVPSDPDYVAPQPSPNCPAEEGALLFTTYSKSASYPFILDSSGNVIKVLVHRPDGIISGIYESSNQNKDISLSDGPVGESEVKTGGLLGYRSDIRHLRIEGDDIDVSSVNAVAYPNLISLWVVVSPASTSIFRLTQMVTTGLNALDDLRFPHNNVSGYNPSANPALRILVMNDNNQSGTLNLTSNAVLEEVHAANNGYIITTTTGAAALRLLDLANNPIPTAGVGDLSGNTNLRLLSLAGTDITAFNPAQVPGIVWLYLDNTGISTLDTTVLTDLADLNVSSTSLATLSISDNNNLVSLGCAGCPFTEDGAATATIDAIIIKMDQNITSGGLLHYGPDNLTGVQPSAAALSAYNSLVSKGCDIIGRPPQ